MLASHLKINVDFHFIFIKTEDFSKWTTPKHSISVTLQDTWFDPPDPAKKSVAVEADCADGATVLAKLFKNLNKDPYSEDEVRKD